MLLSEVALGDMYERKHAEFITKLPDGTLSHHILLFWKWINETIRGIISRRETRKRRGKKNFNVSCRVYLRTSLSPSRVPSQQPRKSFKSYSKIMVPPFPLTWPRRLEEANTTDRYHHHHIPIFFFFFFFVPVPFFLSPLLPHTQSSISLPNHNHDVQQRTEIDAHTVSGIKRSPTSSRLRRIWLQVPLRSPSLRNMVPLYFLHARKKNGIICWGFS